jgi:hypothetical protein
MKTSSIHFVAFLQSGDDNMKPWERILMTLLVCLALLAAVWLHGTLNRYVFFIGEYGQMVRYDRISGKAWLIKKEYYYEIGKTFIQ